MIFFFNFVPHEKKNEGEIKKNTSINGVEREDERVGGQLYMSIILHKCHLC